MVFFCKQKTAYEMRISDWSSDVCSSDLPAPAIAEKAMPTKPSGTERVARPLGDDESTAATELAAPGGGCAEAFTQIEPQGLAATYWGRSEERSAGKECVSKCRSRRSPDH